MRLPGFVCACYHKNLQSIQPNGYLTATCCSETRPTGSHPMHRQIPERKPRYANHLPLMFS